ncbi:MAG: MFS transporter [Pseudomonadota bacterium]
MTEKSIMKSLKPYLIFFLAGLFLCFNMALQVSVSVASAHFMHALNLSATGVGVVSATYYFSYTAMQAPSGFLFDKFSSKKVMATGLLFCLIGTVLFALSKSAAIAAIGRFLTGFGSAFSFVAVLYVAAQWFSQRYFAFIAGLTMVLAALGSICGQGPMSMLIQHFGWRQAMLLFVVIGFIVMLLILVIVQDNPDHKHVITENTSISFTKALAILIKNKQICLIAGYAFAIWAPITCFASLWGVPFIRRAYDISTTEAGFVSSVIWIGIGLGSPLFGWLSDTIEKRKILLILVAAIGCVSSALVVYTRLPIWLLYLMLFLFGIGAAGQSLSFAILKDNTPTHITATAVGINNMAVVFSGFIFQPLVGWLLNLAHRHKSSHHINQYSLSDYHIALMVVPLCFLLSLLIAWLFLKETNARSLHDDNQQAH